MGDAIALLRSAVCMIVLSTTSACATGVGEEPVSAGGGARQPQMAGREVPATRVSLPGTVRRAAQVTGRAPPGSRVETDSGTLTVDGSGTFRLQAPASIGEWHVRIVRPAPMPPMTVSVRVTNGDI